MTNLNLDFLILYSDKLFIGCITILSLVGAYLIAKKYIKVNKVKKGLDKLYGGQNVQPS